MSKANAIVFVLALAGSSAFAPTFGQSVISAHSGTIQFTEGQVNLNGASVRPKFGEFPDVKTDGVLSTADGRAEILLTPGVFLRLGENSSFKMISNQLSNTRLEIQSGAAMVQVGELLPDNSITVAFHGADVSLGKSGLYRFDSDTDPAKLRVYDGEASVVSPSSDPVTVRKGHEIAFSAAKLEAKTFDTKSTDEFYRWNARRDEYIAQANIVAAKTARDSGTGFANSGYGSGLGYGNGLGMGGNGSWAFNPWLGMFTYLPNSGTYFSPFGFGYFSPYAVGYLYGPYSPYYFGNGYPNSGTMIGSNGGITKAATATPTTATTLNRAAGMNGGLGSARSSSGVSSGPSTGGTATRGASIGSGSSLTSGGGHASAGATGGAKH